MGEISDALRRARQPAPPRAANPMPAAPPDAPPPLAPPGRTPGPEADRRGPRVELSASREGAWPARVVVVDGHGAAAEGARHIALRLRRELETRRARSLAVVSSERAEGKTTVACNLALAMASLTRGRAVALVDLDLRAPSVAEVLELPRAHGIDDVLRGRCALAEARVEIERPALDVYPVRVPEADAHELLIAPSFAAVVDALEQRYDVTVFDTPPTLLVPDAPVIVERVGAAVAVSRARHTRQRAFATMLDLLPPGKLVGTVMNEGTLPGTERAYAYYGSPPQAD